MSRARHYSTGYDDDDDVESADTRDRHRHYLPPTAVHVKSQHRQQRYSDSPAGYASRGRVNMDFQDEDDNLSSSPLPPPVRPPRNRVPGDDYRYDVNRAPSPDYTSNDDRAPSDRDLSEYSMEIETKVPRTHYSGSRAPHQNPHPQESHYKSNIQMNGLYKSPSELSYPTYKSAGPPRSVRSGVPPSESATVKTKTSRYGRIQVDTVAAPHPYCPNTKGTCCLMVLFNLALIIIILGFIVVLQIRDPPPLWYFGICMLVFGFCTLIGTLIYCVYVCRDRPDPNNLPYGELYWTHQWRRSLNFGQKPKPNEIFYPPDDAYSFRSSSQRNEDAYSTYSYGGHSTPGRQHHHHHHDGPAPAQKPGSSEYFQDYGTRSTSTRPGRY